MKRTDIEKSIGAKINNKNKQNRKAGPYNKDTEKQLNKREQRKIDQAQGLVPFAVKINSDLVQQIQDIAEEQQTTVNEVVADLLQKGLQNRK